VQTALASEARKYGVGLLLASQDLDHFSRDILNNVATKLVLMHAETAIRTTAGKLLLEKEQLQALKEPFVGRSCWIPGSWIEDAVH
jgi:DNA helicase HerA-like ATPase